MSTVYVVGTEYRLHALRQPPTVWRLKDSKGQPLVWYGWSNISSEHWDERGKLSEGKSLAGARIFARELPADVVSELDTLEAQIAESEATTQRLKSERQALLVAAAVRGKRIKIGDAVPVSPPISTSTPHETKGK